MTIGVSWVCRMTRHPTPGEPGNEGEDTTMTKHTLHLAPVDRGAFCCIPARKIELEGERIRMDCADAEPCIYPGHRGNAGLYVVGNEYGALGAVWCSHEGDAIDALVDADLAGGILIDDETLAAMSEEEREDVHYAGNAGEAVDLDHAWIQRVHIDGARDWRLIAAMAEATGANADTLGDY
jgi:hypothetical protein